MFGALPECCLSKSQTARRENGEKIRHKCCHGDHGDEVYNPIAAASCFYMFGEIANVFHLPELAAYFVELSTECFKVSNIL